MVAVSVVIPAYNEEASIAQVVRDIRQHLQQAGVEPEIVVVVDGATDETAVQASASADKVVVHPQNLGYGRSLKTGILVAKNDLIAITDADSTYPPGRLPDLIRAAERYDMVVGARTGEFFYSSLIKRIGRIVFQRLSEFSAGQRIPDINSGMRVFRKSQIVQFFPVISAGFSFTTTSTLAYLHNDLCILYLPIEYNQRVGRSKVRHLRDSLRALQIIVEAILRCNPLKMFLLLAIPFGLLSLLCLGLTLFLQNRSSLFLASLISLCTCGIIAALGFVSVAIMPRRPLVESRISSPPKTTDQDPNS